MQKVKENKDKLLENKKGLAVFIQEIEMKERTIDQIIEKCRNYFGTSTNGIEKVKEFGDGKSGNTVLMIEVLDAVENEKNGRYVLKISFEKEAEFMNEIVNTVELGKNQENLNGIHFPKYETAGEVDGALYYIYDVAGSELSDTICLSSETSSGGSVLEKISTELLINWNKKFDNKKVTLLECIKEMIGTKRLEIDGRVAERVTSFIGDVLSPSFAYEGDILPNPYYFLSNISGPLGRDITAVIGKIHGDLNKNNIIVNRNFMDNSYETYLIDYSHYRNNGYLFFDHAYLQLNITTLQLFEK